MADPYGLTILKRCDMQNVLIWVLGAWIVVSLPVKLIISLSAQQTLIEPIAALALFLMGPVVAIVAYLSVLVERRTPARSVYSAVVAWMMWKASEKILVAMPTLDQDMLFPQYTTEDFVKLIFAWCCIVMGPLIYMRVTSAPPVPAKD